MKIIYKSIMTVKVDNDCTRSFIHVSCPILHFSHHITAFPYLLAISVIRLDFGNPLIFVNMSYIYMLFLYSVVRLQFNMLLLYLTAEDSLSHYRGAWVIPIIHWHTCQLIIRRYYHFTKTRE